MVQTGASSNQRCDPAVGPFAVGRRVASAALDLVRLGGEGEGGSVDSRQSWTGATAAIPGRFAELDTLRGIGARSYPFDSRFSFDSKPGWD